jgi:hypothetical protein
MVDRLYEEKDSMLYDYTSMNLAKRPFVLENVARFWNALPMLPI